MKELLELTRGPAGTSVRLDVRYDVAFMHDYLRLIRMFRLIALTKRISLRSGYHADVRRRRHRKSQLL